MDGPGKAISAALGMRGRFALHTVHKSVLAAWAEVTPNHWTLYNRSLGNAFVELSVPNWAKASQLHLDTVIIIIADIIMNSYL